MRLWTLANGSQFLERLEANFRWTRTPPVEQGPLRVLLFTSLPDDLDERGRLNVEDEQAQVQEALTGLEQDGQAVLEIPDDGRFETFKRWLTEFKPLWSKYSCGLPKVIFQQPTYLLMSSSVPRD
jgi:hypothetical protein